MSSPFDELSHAELAILGREYLLAGHLIDRAGMPQVVALSDRDGMRDVAIEEWMGASPIYTRRMRRALGFTGDDVGTIFKGMQFDIGAPHKFMDFRYRVHDDDHGEFWLASCGALMDVEPMGEDFVFSMCHDIEDPTFDATACATNPRARMRPVHRPPRSPADRHPHCHWTVEIDAGAEPVPEPEAAIRVARSRAAAVAIAPSPRPEYTGPLDPEFALEDLTRDALVAVAEEVCLQGHLLVHSFLLAVERRHGGDAAADVGLKQLAGVGGVVARRLADMRGIRDGGLDSIAQVLAIHPAFLPVAYVALDLARDGDTLVLSIGDCDALVEEGGWSWPALLAASPDGAGPALSAIVQSVDSRARLAPVGDPARSGWIVTCDLDADVAPEAPEVTLTRFSTGADFVFERPTTN